MDSKYDAFISYRHSELDKFVAVNLHKKLEAFKLPKGVKSPTGKKKIERVFRDQDELPLSSNLSDPITLALENSDFLLVICTPRLPESEWCKREIETFIKLHGRDKVLAVLAEGEPEESFPEALTKEEYEVVNPDGTKEIKVRTLEPLAADVRGKNPREIKKAMNDAVLRICAAIFSLNYDEIKQRHKERAMKRTISIVSAIAAALMLFSAVCIGLMFKIINQSEMIMDQNTEIKQQYTEIEEQSRQIQEQNVQIQEQFKEAQINLAEATTDSADNLLLEGRKQDAVYALRQVMPSSSDDDSYPYTAKTEYALANALEVYGDPDSLYAGRSFESESTIKVLKVSHDFKKIATLDACNNFHVWEGPTGKELYSKTLNLMSFSQSDYLFDFIDADTVIYNENDKIFKLNLKDNSETELVNPNGSDKYAGYIYRFLEPHKYAIFTESDFALFDTASGDCISYHTYSEIDETLSIFTIHNVVLSDDEKTLLFSCSDTFNHRTLVSILDIEADNLITAELPEDYGQSIMIKDDKVYVSCYSFSETWTIDECFLYCLDSATGKTIWKNKTSASFYEMKASTSFKYIFGSEYDRLVVLDAETGDEISTFFTNTKICTLLSESNDGAAVMTSDCLYYRFLDGSNNFNPQTLFISTPDIYVDNYKFGHGNVYLKFRDTSYVSYYYYKDETAEPVIECGFSLNMCVNDEEKFVRSYVDTDSLELYTLDSSDSLLSMESKYSYITFVGDGKDLLANYDYGLRIYNLSDGSVFKDIPSIDCPGFNENAVTNDRNYIISDRDKEGNILLYSLTTGEVEDVFKPDIPLDEDVTVFGLNKTFYAVRRENGALEIYKGKNTKPVYTVSRLLSANDNFKVFEDANVFSIAYVDGLIELYRFEDSVEPIRSFVFSKMSSPSFDTLKYYPNQNIYVMNISLKTLVFNENLEEISYLPVRAAYFPSKECFIYYDNGKGLYSVKHYSYDDLINESDKLLSDYVPSEAITEKYSFSK